MNELTETKLDEPAVMESLEALGFERVYGPEISPEGEYPERWDYSEVILEERLREALEQINPLIPPEGIEEAVRKVKIPQGADLLENNLAFHRMATEGVDVPVRQEDGSIRTVKVWLFDFDEPERNDWLAVNQFTVWEGYDHKRPRADVVLFVNGMPLVLFELKSAVDEEAELTRAYNQIQNYKRWMQSLLTYNAFTVISDGTNVRVGTLTADEDRFMWWRTMDGSETAPEAVPQMDVLIKGMLYPPRFLDILRHFLLFQNDGRHTAKILAAYHQYHATNKAVESTLRATEEKGDRKIGVIWHTQGSGKSLSMVFYAGKLVQELNNPTLVVITDRNDLDDQLFGTFGRSLQLLRQTPVHAKSRKHLRELLDRESGGIIFTTIHKFAPGKEEETVRPLTHRKNVVVIADEAHRSQYGHEAKVKKKKDGQRAEVKYGYAKHMRDALPHASYIGFTGTPVELADKNTRSVFGDYIDVYDMTRAVEDGTTVKIYYESRIAKLNLPESKRPVIDRSYEEITEYEEAEEREKLKSKWSRLEALVGSEKRVQEVAADIVAHFEERQEAITGKAMVVAMSRRIAVDLYNAIVRLRPDWHSDQLDDGKIKVVMTGRADDPESFEPHLTTKKQREMLAKRMKDESDPLQMVIVRDMWLTGFDAPSMHTIYVDKPMRGHNLMQAIARVNRVFRDKPGGLVVDYIGIADSLKTALNEYTERDRRTAGVDTEQAVELLLEKIDLIRDLLRGFDYSWFATAGASERMRIITAGVDFVLGLGEEAKKNFIQWVTELSRAYALCSTTDQAQRLNLEIGYFKAVKSGIVKLIPADNRKKSSAQLDAKINQLVSKSVISEGVVDVLGSVGLNKPNIAILSDEFLEEVKGLEQKNLAVELLRRLLKGKVRSVERRNMIQARKFSEMLEESIIKYQNRAIETTQVIMEMIELAKQMNEAHRRGEDLGLIADEVAFYDALSTNMSAKEVMGDEILKQIARDLTQAIKNDMSIDWNLRASVQAKMRVTIKRLLKKYDYPPDKRKDAIETVMKQAHLMCRNEAENF
ncbi:type I restriction enzyme, R subunit [Melghirimyces thermohalophilus]|uniref:Type I restriction enzyme endonuclease subunit n=1 Tax=Melghirimyces thermohalophilus TaxID=1236220 RepID=A0A1G6RL35_9BACL|nr:type I restriction endonuclease subunit R [Melghirimyces thermohalophilus]SDD05369.1 type I restriction enzyme, R subunit [Melghirimyces thermohalophilus]